MPQPSQERFVTPSNVRAFDAVCERRADRARVLAERYPESSDALRFYGLIASFQRDPSPAKLLELVATHGPPLLRERARELDAAACEAAVEAWASGDDRSSTTSFFGRALLQARVPHPTSESGSTRECPACGYPPQLGCSIPQGDGTTLKLSCSICFAEWRHSRESCPGCGASGLVHYHAAELDHLEVRACDDCKAYIHVVRLAAAPDAVPDVDEIAALPLDVWAAENGYRKLVRNLVGI